MPPSATWTRWLRAAALLGVDSGGAKGVTRFTTLRRVLDFAVIFPLLACAVAITVAVLGCTVLVARLLSVSIDCLERLSTACLSGRTRT